MAFMRNTLTCKGEEETADNLVTKALEDLTTSVNERLTDADKKIGDLEQKADTSKLQTRLDKLEAKMNRPGSEGAEGDVSEERKAFALYLRKGTGAPDAELKALNISTDAQGGYLAPEELSTEMIRELTEYSPVRSVASVRSITAPSVKYPRRDNITNANWIDEQAEQVESDMFFSQVEIEAHKLATFVDISNELLADSGGTAEAEVRMALAEDFGQKEGQAFLNGTGTRQPEGILTNTGITEITAASGTEVDPDELIGLMYDLPAMYRSRGTWAMNGTTLAAIRKLKDGHQNYLWQPSYQAGQPETILGRPVIELPDMADAEAGATPIIYGDFEGYRIIDRLAMSVLVNPYLLATRGVTRIHATRRVGGKVIQASRFRKYTMAAA